MNSNRLLLYAALCSVFVFLDQPVSCAKGTHEDVQLKILECSAHTNAKLAPTIALRRLNERFPKDWALRTMSVHGGVANASLYVPQGVWVSYISTGNGCNGMFDLTVLSGFGRSLTVSTLLGAPLYSDHGSVEGTVPLPGLRLAVAVCTSPCTTPEHFIEYPAVVDGGSYYVNYLPSGKWFLRIRSANALQPSIDFR